MNDLGGGVLDEEKGAEVTCPVCGNKVFGITIASILTWVTLKELHIPASRHSDPTIPPSAFIARRWCLIRRPFFWLSVLFIVCLKAQLVAHRPCYIHLLSSWICWS